MVIVRHLYVGHQLYDKEPLKPSSKIEETVQALKEDLKEKPSVAVVAEKPPLLKRIKKKIVDEALHYYHGFRLLFIDINVSRKLVWRVLNGKSLTRREHRLVIMKLLNFLVRNFEVLNCILGKLLLHLISYILLML
jgi:LETM1 and EF-hand domain-containing protein 1